MSLSIFYDSHCPLCMLEIEHLKNHDQHNVINLIDLHDDDLQSRYPYIDKKMAMQKLHGQLDSGEMIYGLDVTYHMWKSVGKYRWLKILRLPIIRTLTDLIYRFFARYRNSISYLLTGKKRCTRCAIKKS